MKFFVTYSNFNQNIHSQKKITVLFAESISQLGVHQLMKCLNKNTEAVQVYEIHPTASSHPLKLTGVNLNW